MKRIFVQVTPFRRSRFFRPRARMSSLKAAFFSAGLFVVMGHLSFAFAGETDTGNDALLRACQSSAEHLENERPQEAIRELEAFADSGMLHPELSFNRGLGYMSRAASSAGQPGDYGQAAAGFAETLLDRPDDAEALRGLEEAQLAVSRKRAQGAGAAVTEPLGLFEKALDSVSPLLFLGLAILGSLLTCTGIVLRRSDREVRRTAGTITWGIGVLLLVPGFGLAKLQNSLFQNSEVAVVISAQAPLYDDAGKRILDAPALQESTVVHIGPAMQGLAPLVGLGSQKWIRTGQLRVLRTNAQ